MATTAEKVRKKKDKALAVSDEKKDPKAMGHYGILGGRPVAYETPEMMMEVFKVYLEACDEHRRIPSKAGLTLALGISRDTINEYGKKPGFSDTVKYMNAVIEDEWVQRLPRAQSQGAVFYLKAAFKYREDDRDPMVGLTINFIMPPEISAKNIPQIEPPKHVEAVVIPEAVVAPNEVPPSTVTSSE